MREISLYTLKPVFIAGDPENLICISKKIKNDDLIFEQIEKDYNDDKKKYKKEYLNAKINHLKNKRTYGWLLLKKFFEDAMISETMMFHDCQKEEMKNKGWILPQFFINNRIVTINNSDASLEEIYMNFFDSNFDILFGFDLEEDKNARSNRYYKQAIINYKSSNYYSCAVSLFPIIEYYHRLINKYESEKFYHIVDNLENVSKKINDVQQIFSMKIEYYIKLVEQLNDLIKNHYFNRNCSRKNEPEIINRNRLMHGLFLREVSKKDCLQLFCVISNMLRIRTIIYTNEMIKNIKKQIDGITRSMKK